MEVSIPRAIVWGVAEQVLAKLFRLEMGNLEVEG